RVETATSFTYCRASSDSSPPSLHAALPICSRIGVNGPGRPSGSLSTTLAATASCPSRNTVAETSNASPTTALAGLLPHSTDGRTSRTGMRPMGWGVLMGLHLRRARRRARARSWDQTEAGRSSPSRRGVPLADRWPPPHRRGGTGPVVLFLQIGDGRGAQVPLGGVRRLPGAALPHQHAEGVAGVLEGGPYRE